MEDLPIGSIVLAAFPFSDLSAKKMRPCFVIGLAEFDDVVLCQITSQPYGSHRAISLTRGDFSSGTIASDSFIRPDKIATLDKSMIKQVLGSVNASTLDQVKLSLKAFLEIA